MEESWSKTEDNLPVAKRNIELQYAGLVAFGDIWPANELGVLSQSCSPL